MSATTDIHIERRGEFTGSVADVDSRVVGWKYVAERCAASIHDVLCVAIGVVGLPAVNTDFCRSTGDFAIAEIHRRLKVAGGRDCIVERIDGGCFLALLNSGDHDRLAVERFLHVSRPPIAGPHGDVVLGLAAGVSSGPSRTPLILFDAAVRNMEYALERGAGSIEWTNSPARPRTSPARLAAPLLTAVDHSEVGADFQPVVSLLTGDVVEFEAFARWPSRPQVSPRSMAALAKDMGILGEFRSAVVASTIELLNRHEGAAWLRRISINVGARELASPSFVGAVLSGFDDAGIVPTALQIEVIDAIPESGVEQAAIAIDMLHERGVRIALDGLRDGAVDWLTMIKLDVDAIKIESDLFTAERPGRAEACFRSILELATEFGVEVVAKGVETAEQHERLVSAGCLYGQGWLYGKPEPSHCLSASVTDRAYRAWADLAPSNRPPAIGRVLSSHLFGLRPPTGIQSSVDSSYAKSLFADPIAKSRSCVAHKTPIVL